jgi:hypothetical protein
MNGPDDHALQAQRYFNRARGHPLEVGHNRKLRVMPVGDPA